MFGGKNLPEHAIPTAKFDAAKYQDVRSDLPFPCSETNCGTFHPNRHGFCHKHRFHRFGRKLSSAVVRTLGWLELALLLTIQAAAEIQSRFLLLLILLSLLPVTCIFLEQSTDMSAASICVTCLVVSVGTCLYTAKRLDGMQQRRFNMALAAEASYFQVLQPTSETSDNLVQMSTILRNHSDGLSQEVQQTEQDLESNYQLAKRHMNLFQTLVCEPLASTGLEVTAKIQSLTELDEREGGADILCCEVWCDSLQEVQDAWDMLKDLDGVEIVSAGDFFAVASSKKCLRVVVSVQGYLATVVLMEKSLSSWEAQKSLSDAADSLGLLDKTKASAWEVSRLQRDSEVPECVFVATAFLRFFALGSCYIICGQIGAGNYGTDWDRFFGLYCYHKRHQVYDEYGYEYDCGNGLKTLTMSLPFLTCFLILLWEMLSCCSLCRQRRRSFKIRPRPTQLWYRRYLGVQGCYYAFKVAALQLLTVVMQGLAKASLFRSIQDAHGPEALWASTTVHCFMLLLLCNILFPAMILVMPNYVFSRVAAALLDAVLDVGYMVTSILLYVFFATTASLSDIFLSNFLNYMSIYICVAHVLCVCRSLETADWIALFQVPRAANAFKAWKRMIVSSAYTLALLAFVGIAVGGIVLGAFSDPSHGLCPPCECSAVAPASILLERCVIPSGYVAQGAPDIEFNLTNRNITEVLRDAFVARGEHQKVRSLSLRGNHLTELPDGLFRDLLQQVHLNSEYNDAADIDIIDLADNRLATLPRGVFQSDSLRPMIDELHLEGNCLTTLPPGVFQGLTIFTLDMSRGKLQALPPKVFDGLEVNRLYLQNNDLSQLHAETFQGLAFGSYGSNNILDMSQNNLQVLPPKVFDGLTLARLYLQNNSLSHLHAETFQGLSISFPGILDMSQNNFQVLPPKAFDGLELSKLYLQNNSLSQLHPETFHGLSFQCYGTACTLDMSCNKLQDLPQDVFRALNDLEILNISRNKLQDAPPNLFDGMRDLKILDLAENELSTLPDQVFYYFIDLHSLRLEGNRLRSLGTRLFYWLIRLKELSLEQNQLTDLDEDVFESDVATLCCTYWGDRRDYIYLSLKWNLLELNLGGNRLTTLPDGIFNGFRRLGTLQLQSNRLARLPKQLFQTLGEVHWAFTEFQPYLPSTLHLFPLNERELDHFIL